MKPKRVYTDYLHDILEACDNATQFVEGLSDETFKGDDKTQYAVIRALTIIGEAVKKIPNSVQNRYPDVPWKMMAGMRDIVIHGTDEWDADFKRRKKQ